MSQSIRTRLERLEGAMLPTAQIIVVMADADPESWPQASPGCVATYVIIETGVPRAPYWAKGQ